MERRKMQELESARANQSNGVIESKNSSDGERDISINGRCSSSNGHSKTVRERKDSGRSGWQVEFDKTLSSEDRPSSSASTADFGFNDDLLCDHSLCFYKFYLSAIIRLWLNNFSFSLLNRPNEPGWKSAKIGPASCLENISKILPRSIRVHIYRFCLRRMSGNYHFLPCRFYLEKGIHINWILF